MTNASEPKPDCALCPRLAAYRLDNRRAFPEWHNAPVASFGTSSARLLIVGLAPGLKGANRTGRPFTGDAAGDVLYPALDRCGFAHGTYARRADDGLHLPETMITNAVRCVPPQNRPNAAEISNCRSFLIALIASLDRVAAILALGRIAHESLIRGLCERGKLASIPFAHGRSHDISGPGGRPLRLFSSYHCSRYNINTRRLTPAMLEAVLMDIADFLGL